MGFVRAVRLVAVAGGVLVVALSACASPGKVGDGGGLVAPAHDYEAVAQWAAEVADAWSPTGDAWQRGFVPLQEPVSVDGILREPEKRAMAAGWWASAVPLPTDRPGRGSVMFRDGSLPVTVLSAAEAYRQMDLGDPPPCVSAPPSAAVQPSAGPDGSVSAPAGGDCEGLTVRGASLASIEMRTSRGVATVPAWRFALDGGRAVLRAAVADPAPVPSPAATPTRAAPPEMVAAQGITDVSGLEVHYQLGVGACDRDITPIVAERADVVVITGGVTRSAGECTDQLLIEPVSVTLTEPLGDRPVLDGRNGTLLPVGDTP
jgi:hypothetical protein